MKSTKSSILWAVVAGAVASAGTAGCGSSPEKVSTVDNSKADDGGAELPLVDAEAPVADAAPEVRHDSGSGPDGVGDSGASDDCASFTSLPVDTVFLPTGWMGDTAAVTSVDCTVERSSGAAAGNCHEVTYVVPMESKGWAGINWQNPKDYWADPPEAFVGFPMPCGATKISFYARGGTGGEVLDFYGGNTAYQAKLDKVALTAEWKLYSMTFNGSPDDNVTLGFGWSIGAEAAGGVGATAKFYIDDIRWE